VCHARKPLPITGETTVCCSVLQCVAVCCSVLQCVAAGEKIALQHVAVCCCVLPRAAVSCSMLQCVVVCCSVLQCVAVCCSVLQRVCNAFDSQSLSNARKSLPVKGERKVC